MAWLASVPVITSSSDEKLEKARDLGAMHTVNYRAREDWGRAVREATEGRGVDNVLDVGGEGTWAQTMLATRTGGHVAMIGAVSGVSAAGGAPAAYSSAVELRRGRRTGWSRSRPRRPRALRG